MGNDQKYPSLYFVTKENGIERRIEVRTIMGIATKGESDDGCQIIVAMKSVNINEALNDINISFIQALNSLLAMERNNGLPDAETLAKMEANFLRSLAEDIATTDYIKNIEIEGLENKALN